MGHAERANLERTKAENTNYLRAIAAMLVEQGGEIRVPASTYALLDPEMIIRQSVDPEKQEMVFTLISPTRDEVAN